MSETEHDWAHEMARALQAVGVKAEVVNTGGNCWAAEIELTDWASMQLTNLGDGWTWTIYRSNEVEACGTWDDSDTAEVTAAHVVADFGRHLPEGSKGEKPGR